MQTDQAWTCNFFGSVVGRRPVICSVPHRWPLSVYRHHFSRLEQCRRREEETQRAQDSTGASSLLQRILGPL